MTTPGSTSRSRVGHKDKKFASEKTDGVSDNDGMVIDSTKKLVTSEWDFKLALTIITLLSFITRFWGISHPNEVVFDEVHFGKVSRSETEERGEQIREQSPFVVSLR
jgi:hypothetical protein